MSTQEQTVPAEIVPTRRPAIDALLDACEIEIDYVTVTLGRTINLGNYENLRLDVRLGGRLAEGASHRRAMQALAEEADAEIDRQETYFKLVEREREWFMRQRTLAQLQARRDEIAADEFWHPKDQVQLLAVADEYIGYAEKREAEKARQREEDLATLGRIIESARTWKLTLEKDRYGEPVMDWQGHLSRREFDLHSRVLHWAGLTRAQWAAATPEDLLQGIVPRIEAAPAPATPAPHSPFVEPDVAYYLLVDPNSDTDEDGAWLCPGQVAEFNETRRAEGDDRRWVLAKEVNAEAPSGADFDDFDADSYRVEFEPLDFDSFSNEPVTDEYEG